MRIHIHRLNNMGRHVTCSIARINAIFRTSRSQVSDRYSVLLTIRIPNVGVLRIRLYEFDLIY